MRRLAILPLVLLLALTAPLACTTTVVCPSEPADPVRAFLLTEAMTSSLALPATNGGLVRYAYGDWRYYALAKNTLWNGVAALLWPTQGTLGRGELPPSGDAEQVRQATSAERVHELVVERASVARLAERLDASFTARSASEVNNAGYRLRFVHHDRHYTYFHNSNHTVADWVGELGCEVRGPTYAARWRVEKR